MSLLVLSVWVEAVHRRGCPRAPVCSPASALGRRLVPLEPLDLILRPGGQCPLGFLGRLCSSIRVGGGGNVQEAEVKEKLESKKFHEGL